MARRETGHNMARRETGHNMARRETGHTGTGHNSAFSIAIASEANCYGDND
jgi:hypothetical protein